MLYKILYKFYDWLRLSPKTKHRAPGFSSIFVGPRSCSHWMISSVVIKRGAPVMLVYKPHEYRYMYQKHP